MECVFVPGLFHVYSLPLCVRSSDKVSPSLQIDHAAGTNGAIWADAPVLVRALLFDPRGDFRLTGPAFRPRETAIYKVQFPPPGILGAIYSDTSVPVFIGPGPARDVYSQPVVRLTERCNRTPASPCGKLSIHPRFQFAILFIRPQYE
jgi:hypothetical protein